MNQITTTAPLSPNHAYFLSHGLSPRTGHFLVNDFTETFTGPQSTSRSIAHFEWNSRPTTPYYSGVPNSLPNFTDNNANVALMDLTGDGLPDFVLTDEVGGLPFYEVSTSAGAGTFNPLQAQLAAPTGTPTANGVDRGIAIDYDQDGYDDILRYDAGNTNLSQTWQLMHTEHGANNNVLFDPFDTQVARTFRPAPESLLTQFASAHFADVNGDGMVDLIQCFRQGLHEDAFWTVDYWAPIGSPTGGAGFVQPAQHITGLGLENYMCDVPLQVADVDGDHRAELIIPDGTLSNGEFVLHSPYIAMGTRADGTWERVATTIALPTDGGTTWLDINGDGLVDAVQDGPNENNLEVYFNNGSFFETAVPALAVDVENIFLALRGGAVIDINGDGRRDLLVPQFSDTHTAFWTPLLATGSLTVPFKEFSTNDFNGTHVVEAVDEWGDVVEWTPSTDNAVTPKVADLDGDGASDVILYNPVGGSDGRGSFDVYRSSLGDEDSLYTVTNGTNARTIGDPLFVADVTVLYAHLVDSAMTSGGGPTDETTTDKETSFYLSRWDQNNTCAFPRHCVVGSRPIVRSYILNDGEDNQREFAVKYRDGRADIEGRGWIGFGSRIVTNMQTGAGSFASYDNINPELNGGDYSGAGIARKTIQWIPALGFDADPARVDVTVEDSSRHSYPLLHAGFSQTYFSALMSVTSSKFQEDFTPTAGESLLAWVQTIDGGSYVPLSRTNTSYGYDAFGNVSSLSSATDGVDLTTTRSRTYSNDEGQWILGRPLTDDTCSTSGGREQCRNNGATYDSVGRAKTHSFRTSDSSTVAVDVTDAANAAYDEEFIYDSFGNVTSLRKYDTLSHDAYWCASYDAQGVFPQAFRNPVGHFSFVAYDPRLGQKIAEVDPNQVVTQWSYDGWGRPASEVRVDGHNTATTFQQVTDPTHGLVIQKEVQVAGGEDVTTQFDAAGRPTIIWSGAVTPCVTPCASKPRTKRFALYDAVHMLISKVSIEGKYSLPKMR